MNKAEFINDFNRYNLERADERGTKYIAMLDDFANIEIYDYDDVDFYAYFYVINDNLIIVNVSYCGEADEDSCSVKDDRMPNDIVSYVVDELDRLTRNLVESMNN